MHHNGPWQFGHEVSVQHNDMQPCLGVLTSGFDQGPDFPVAHRGSIQIRANLDEVQASVGMPCQKIDLASLGRPDISDLRPAPFQFERNRGFQGMAQVGSSRAIEYGNQPRIDKTGTRLCCPGDARAVPAGFVIRRQYCQAPFSFSDYFFGRKVMLNCFRYSSRGGNPSSFLHSFTLDSSSSG